MCTVQSILKNRKSIDFIQYPKCTVHKLDAAKKLEERKAHEVRATAVIEFDR